MLELVTLTLRASRGQDVYFTLRALEVGQHIEMRPPGGGRVDLIVDDIEYSGDGITVYLKEG